jgi:hypothetical protein
MCLSPGDVSLTLFPPSALPFPPPRPPPSASPSRPASALFIPFIASPQQYTELRVRERMLQSCESQLGQLLVGVYSVVPQHVLSVFSFQEVG